MKKKPIVRGSLCVLAVVAPVVAVAPRPAVAQPPLVLGDNMKVLQAKMPDGNYRFTGSNAPGQLFFPDEPVNIHLVFTKGNDTGAVKDFSLEIQEISTRNPDARSKDSFTDTSGAAPIIGLEGKPISVPLAVTFTDKPEEPVDVSNLPLPKRFGTYAVVLVRGAGAAQTRQFLATLARVPRPRPYGTVDNTPIFGEGQMMDQNHIEQRAQQYARMGVRGWRSETAWTEKLDGTTDWTYLDKLFGAAKAAGCQVMLTLGGTVPQWRPFGDPTPASGWNPDSGGYGGTGDWLMAPSLYPRYGKWIEQVSAKYWEGGKGGLWGYENYNEPWEGGGISGWARDAVQYRELQKLIAESARKVDPKIKILAASSIMNTEDKLFSDGKNTMDLYIDIFTDHYVVPPMCYGPMVAASKGKESMETETWFVNSEYLLPQGVAQFMGSGQKRIAPWHPRVLFDRLPGTYDDYFIPTPVVTATAAFNYFVTGKTFEKMIFQENLPFAFQFGKDTDKDALIVLFGKLLTIGGNSAKDILWAQVNAAPGGTMTIENGDKLLQFYDTAGNPEYVGQKQVKLAMAITPTYITCAKGPVAAAARLKAAKIEGKRPVEILPHDFTTPVTDPKASFVVEIHNCLNRDIKGELKVTPPAGFELVGGAARGLTLKAGEKQPLTFAVKGIATENNAYPFSFSFTSDAGSADYAETLNAAIVTRGTKTVDGNLDDWKDVPGVSAIGLRNSVDPTELLRRPWLEVAGSNPDATVGELKLAWDDQYLYVAARVRDTSPQTGGTRFSKRDEDSYFHSAADDNIEPYKTFIDKFREKTGDPKRSFAEVPYVYRRNPEEGIPFRRDRIQLAFDTTPGWHDMKEVTNVPLGFHAYPDTDYEYSIYPAMAEGDGASEVWRHLAPGVPRIHDFPRQVRGERTTGAVADAKSIVKRDGDTYIYEAAIPRTELADMKWQAGADFGFAFRIGNSGGPQADYGTDKAMTKNNGLTLHPYWERTPSAGTRWTLVQ